jgi:hypothetical protein
MHVVQPRRNDLFGGIRHIAPYLPHLRFSGLQGEVDFGVSLEVALGIGEEPSRLSQGSRNPPPLHPPPHGTGQLHRLNEKESRSVGPGRHNAQR